MRKLYSEKSKMAAVTMATVITTAILIVEICKFGQNT